MKFTERFNECLKYSDMKQSEIAKYCKTTRQNISNFKTGRTYPSIETLYLLCECLDVSADYLLGLEE
ncbi:MAG: helix-turn-helix domain-containing protein [Clostridia bacterium]|nr:helix-turn-helix domain-containing protein [Clostridia bacterium]